MFLKAFSVTSFLKVLLWLGILFIFIDFVSLQGSCIFSPVALIEMHYSPSVFSKGFANLMYNLKYKEISDKLLSSLRAAC